jgi:hypothetical protein
MNYQPTKNASVHERRQAVRVPYRTSLKFASHDHTGKGNVRDVSSDGLFLETPDVFAVGDPIDMDFRFRHTRVNVPIAGEIRHVSPQGVGVRLIW